MPPSQSLRFLPDRHPDDDPQPPSVPPAVPPSAQTPWLDEQLFGRRMLFLRDLEPDTAARAAATVLALDAMAADPITLHMSADQGSLAAAWTLVDALDAVRAPVHATAIGQVGAAALGVFCATAKRSAFPHARFRLAEPKVTSPGGTADQVVAEAGRYLRDLEDLILRVAEATGQPRSRVEDDLQSGRFLSAEEALTYGLITDIVTR